MQENHEMKEILQKIEKNARLQEREPRATHLWNDVKKVIDRMLPQYSAFLGLPEVEILRAIEGKRDYWSPNYYQDSKWPDLGGDVRVFKSQQEMMAAIGKMEFRCCTCNGITTNPYECNSGLEMEAGKTCDWKTYGLFRTMGHGLRFTFKDGFLDNPKVDEIFMPIAFEKKDAA